MSMDNSCFGLPHLLVSEPGQNNSYMIRKEPVLMWSHLSKFLTYLAEFTRFEIFLNAFLSYLVILNSKNHFSLKVTKHLEKCLAWLAFLMAVVCKNTSILSAINVHPTFMSMEFKRQSSLCMESKLAHTRETTRTVNLIFSWDVR